MGGAVNTPGEVKGEDIPGDGLGCEGMVPVLVPAVHGDHHWQEETEQQFQREEISEKQNVFGNY